VLKKTVSQEDLSTKKSNVKLISMRKIPFIFFYNPKFFFLNALLAGG
jgi:hypothetical protein